MNQRNDGFTLVELMVVIMIIGILVALLVPAILAAREQGRQATCLNNQQQLGKATIQYELAKNHFPGTTVLLPGGNIKLNWCMSLFPYIGRQDMWDNDWSTGNSSGTAAKITVDQFVCPDDPPAPGLVTPLSYVANFNIYNPGNASPITMSQINTPQRTIMYTERARGGAAPTGPWQPYVYSSSSPGSTSPVSIYPITFVPWGLPGMNATQLASLASSLNSGGATFLSYTPNPSVSVPQISSNHPGTIVVTYFDGHSEKLPDDTWLAPNASMLNYLPGP
ncbi:MAG: DUF1559 domain-containing protein [Thermoguttaceae bacterium]|jgi:prepilin-type N-terminal cleavage/methylation domain-containing protein